MITAGCDIGSRFGKIVILRDGEILSYAITRADMLNDDTSDKVLNMALEGLDITLDDIDYVVGTGYGQSNISFANETVSELPCIAMGAYSVNPKVRMVIDIGGQDAKVVKVDDKGGVQDFVLNDKCASGTGHFLEDIARVLEVGMEDMGPLAMQSENPAPISSQCSVFAKSEVVSLIAAKTRHVDIAAGISEAISSRTASMIYRITAEEDAIMSGGVAKNAGVVKNLQEKIGLALVPYSLDPQLVCALGAALIAANKAGKQS